MLLALGVQPSDEEVDEMMSTVDTADGINAGDGKIDMREFLVWYAKGLSSSRNEDQEDATDAFRVLSRQQMDEYTSYASPSASGGLRAVQPQDKVHAAPSLHWQRGAHSPLPRAR